LVSELTVEQSLTVDILEYLYSIVSILNHKSNGTIRTDCYKCNEKDQVISFVARFPWKMVFIFTTNITTAALRGKQNRKHEILKNNSFCSSLLVLPQVS
jgi:hypothetical protein